MESSRIGNNALIRCDLEERIVKETLKNIEPRKRDETYFLGDAFHNRGVGEVLVMRHHDLFEQIHRFVDARLRHKS